MTTNTDATHPFKPILDEIQKTNFPKSGALEDLEKEHAFKCSANSDRYVDNTHALYPYETEKALDDFYSLLKNNGKFPQ